MDIDLSGMTVNELINLRGRVAAEIERQTILAETPVQVGQLASRYRSVGGDPAVLRDALTDDPEGDLTDD